ncbi:MAG: hypothetical protein M8357_10005 [Desulfobulbaceae bacterium]|nr:hypothetical protein [Desulfobulbaceae bacterium]
MTNSNDNRVKADLRTAQNRMLPEVEKKSVEWRESGLIETLAGSPEELRALFFAVRQKLFDLLHISASNRNDWHMGITDSGKRTIEMMVNAFCAPEEGKNVVVNTENYVAFNKFSAVNALATQKGVEFEWPFDIALGRALTVNSESEFEKARQCLGDNGVEVLWIAWNSTSTGVRERVERLVEFRNANGSPTLIVADAASLSLFTQAWQEIPAANLPDSFYFSLRKQGLPYEGPQDEANQAKNSGAVFVFNDRARARAQVIGAKPVYDLPSLEEMVRGEITTGEQRRNHVHHLLKLRCALDLFAADAGSRLAANDEVRRTFQEAVINAFASRGKLGRLGFALLADTEAQSETSYIVEVPDGVSTTEIINDLKTKGVEISKNMHPKLDSKKLIRFACYPGNQKEEVHALIEGLAECVEHQGKALA